MIQSAKSALQGVAINDYVSDPREDYRRWRNSDRPAYDLVHGILETVLIAGQGLRYFCHMLSYSIYYHSKHGKPPEFSDDMFGFNNLVKPVLEPIDWKQEALMRGSTFLLGLFFFSLAVGTRDTTEYMMYEAISPVMVYWGRMLLATHLMLDPLLGIAWRIANADLKEWY